MPGSQPSFFFWSKCIFSSAYLTFFFVKIGDSLAEALVPKVKGTDAPIDDFKAFFGGLATLETGNEIVFTQVRALHNTDAHGKNKYGTS